MSSGRPGAKLKRLALLLCSLILVQAGCAARPDELPRTSVFPGENVSLTSTAVSTMTWSKPAALRIEQLASVDGDLGMGYLLIDSAGTLTVIDGGSRFAAEQLGARIQAYGGWVDHWILTHPHPDHIGAFLELPIGFADRRQSVSASQSSLLSGFTSVVPSAPASGTRMPSDPIPVGEILFAENDLAAIRRFEPDYAPDAVSLQAKLADLDPRVVRRQVGSGSELVLVGGRIRFLSGANPDLEVNYINNSCLTFRVDAGNASALFLGDLGAEGGRRLLAAQRAFLQTDIVQMAHHGQSGVERDVYEAIGARIALWPTPEWLWRNVLIPAAEPGKKPLAPNTPGLPTGPWKTLDVRQWMSDLGAQPLPSWQGRWTIDLYSDGQIDIAGPDP